MEDTNFIIWQIIYKFEFQFFALSKSFFFLQNMVEWLSGLAKI
jgi:hypothetical protein